MGDGDCVSIGAGHWVHAVRYNVNMVALLLDNEGYVAEGSGAEGEPPHRTWLSLLGAVEGSVREVLREAARAEGIAGEEEAAPAAR